MLASVTYPAYGAYPSPSASYAYDATGAMASVTDWLGNTVGFGHDQDGNLSAQDNAVSAQAPSGTSSTAFAYDAADQLTGATSTLACSGAAGTLSQYFAVPYGSANPDGQVTQDQEAYSGACTGASYERNYSYDEAGRVTYQGSAPQGANPANFAYDPAGDPTTFSATPGATSTPTPRPIEASDGRAHPPAPDPGRVG